VILRLQPTPAAALPGWRWMRNPPTRLRHRRRSTVAAPPGPR